jgi:hypothetical protein
MATSLVGDCEESLNAMQTDLDNPKERGSEVRRKREVEKSEQKC